MKYLKLFEEFDEISNIKRLLRSPGENREMALLMYNGNPEYQSKEMDDYIKEITNIINTCEKYSITNYVINEDLRVDVNGDVDIMHKHGMDKLEKIPIKFGKVTGRFRCIRNLLTSLEGGPKEVGGDYYCNNNNLTSLEGSPKYVGGAFICSTNKLTTLEGCPTEVESFYCNNNNLTSLEGCPKTLVYSFDCSYNNLTSLEFCPSEVGGKFYCGKNELTSLIGSPRKVSSFSCDHNGLVSLEGCPELSSDGYFNYNKILNLDGLPKDIFGIIDLYDNPIVVIQYLFPDVGPFLDSVKYKYFVGGNKIDKSKLTKALSEYNKKCPDSIEGYEFV